MGLWVEKNSQLDVTEWFIALRTAVVQHPSSWTHSLLLCTWPPTTSNQGTAHHRR